MLRFTILCFFLCFQLNSQAVESVWAFPGTNGKLSYLADSNGNTLPDFSYCGYRGGGVTIPSAIVQQTLNPLATGDDRTRIQNAINAVAALPADSNGLRGAVLLTAGIYRISNVLNLASGVVLRGAGQDPSGANSTLIIATSGWVMVNIGGSTTAIASINTASRQTLLDSYVPVGSRRFRVTNPANFAIGDSVLLERPCTGNWISEIDMDKISQRPGDPNSTQQWYAGKVDLKFERTVTAVDATHVTLDSPAVNAMETLYGGGTLVKFTPTARLREVGVEKLRLQSQYIVGTENIDQANAGWAVTIGLAENCWVREVTGLHFAGGTVAINEPSIRITVEDCANLDPVSTITGGRRYSFPINGQQVLVQRCYSRKGRHDFITGYQCMGTNVYLDCFAEKSYDDSGPHNCWSTGILYDSITADDLLVQDRDYLGTGQGWAGANHVLWNCTATIVCQNPPTANNWAIGCKGTLGNPVAKVPPRVQGNFDSWQTAVATRSLYLRQLSDRLGTAAVNNITTTAQRAGSITAALNTRFDEISPAVQWPNLTPLANQVINVNTSTATLPITVGDAQTANTALVLTGTSSNTALVPNANIVFGGSAAARNVKITPVTNQIGTSTITVRVSDGALSAARTFTVSVTSNNAPPTISAIADQATLQGTPVGPLSFIVADDVTPPEALTLSATSTNQTVLPNANIVFSTAWEETDLGNVAVDGSATLGDIITINASGADISGAADEGYLLSQPVSGNTEMIARVLSLETTDTLAKAGVMMRQNSAGNSPHCYMQVTAAGGVQFSQRLSTGGVTTSTTVPGVSAPCWVRLVKSASNFTAYYATETNGTRGAWIQVGSTTAVPAITGTFRAGLASTSGSDGNLGTSTFDNVTGSANRRVTINPAPGVFGKLTVSISVSDGQFSTAETFILRVNSPLSVTSTLASTAADAKITESASVDSSSFTSALGTGGSSPYVDASVVFVFQLPSLGAVANPFTETSFTFNYTSKNGTLKRMDLYGLGRRASANVLGSDYYGSNVTVDATDATRLQTGILVDSSPIGLTSTSATGDTSLLNYLNNQYASGAGQGQFVFLRLNTGEVKTAIDRAFITMSEGSTTTPIDTRPRIVYTAFPANNSPTISDIANQILPLNSSSAAIPFIIGDGQTAANALALSVTSSNLTLAPLSGIVLGGTGANRTVSITPATMQTGTSTITLTVNDGTLSTSDSFLLTVDESAAGRFAYLFNQAANFEGWIPNTTLNTPIAATVAGGSFNGTLQGDDPQLVRSGLNFPGNNVQTILIRLTRSTAGSGQLFFGNEAGSFSQANTFIFPVAASSTFRWYAINATANSNWSSSTTPHTIRALRFDPPGTTGTVSIDAIIGSNGDFDQDGIPDIWEVANQLDPTSAADAQLDPDLDGLTNAGEYALGTNPTVADMGPAITISRVGGNFALTFIATAATGTGYSGITRYYDVETSTTLNSWAGLSNYTGIIGAGQTVTFTQSPVSGPRFYRLKVRLLP